ncbi:hypothetical protein [Lacticaseibacillus suihuaensis]
MTQETACAKILGPTRASQGDQTARVMQALQNETYFILGVKGPQNETYFILTANQPHNETYCILTANQPQTEAYCIPAPGGCPERSFSATALDNPGEVT